MCGRRPVGVNERFRCYRYVPGQQFKAHYDGAFQRLGQAHPTEHDTSFPDMIASVTEQPFRELKGAIQSKDDAGFAKAYADLTSGCNACHQALNHGVVAIRVPGGTSTSDQDFNSAAPRNPSHVNWQNL